MGVHKERQRRIPEEIIKTDYRVITETQEVLKELKTAYENLYNNIFFNESQVPKEWCGTIINPILRRDKDPRDSLSYRGISLISVPCKIYADILNDLWTGSKIIPY